MMSILLDQNTGCMVQGITGREARIRAATMKEYGTRLVCGITPGRGGEVVEGDIPVYDTVEEAKENHPEVAASALMVPAALVKNAAFEAIDAGIKVILLIPERVPQQDMLEIIERSRKKGSFVVGPNSIGLISPGKALLGMIGGTPELARELFKEGECGVMSRSGGHTTTTSYYLTREGVGQSTCVAVGGDAFVGSSFDELLPLFETDPQTRAVVIFGEPGTTAEEDVARMMEEKKFTKPLIAYVAGKYVRPGMRFGHAGAIINKGEGRVEDKLHRLRKAGVHVVDHLGDVGKVARELNLK